VGAGLDWYGLFFPGIVIVGRLVLYLVFRLLHAWFFVVWFADVVGSTSVVKSPITIPCNWGKKLRLCSTAFLITVCLTTQRDGKYKVFLNSLLVKVNVGVAIV
jgi:hypothetical protein